MFDSIRKHQRILQFVLLLLIFPAFALFGVSGYQQYISGSDEVATVKGESISRQEFEQAQRRQLENLRQMLGNQIDPKMLDNDAARAEVLESLITQRALLTEAQAQRITIPDAKLRDAILSIQGLKKPDGSFDRDQYKALLSAQGMNEAMFESQMRRDLALQSIPEALAQTGFLPRSVAERLLILQQESREVRELVFKPESYEAQVKVTDEQLKKHYEDNGSLFETAESARIEYVVLSSDMLAAQVTLDPAKIKEYYEQNQNRYAVAEQRRASHILLTVPKDADDKRKKEIRARIEALLAQIKAGGDFAALAKANSQDPGSAGEGGDLGFFSADMMAKPFADSAFALKQGETSDIVETQFGYHVIRVTGIKPKAVRSFDDAKPEIEAEFRKQEAAREYAKAAETFSNTVYEQSDSFKPVVDKLKLKVETVDSVSRAGAAAEGKHPLLTNPKLLAALFASDSIKNKRNTDAVEVAPNTMMSARILEHRPARRKPYAEVEAEVRSSLVKSEARKLALLAGEGKLKELKDNKAAATGGGFGEARKVTRNSGNELAGNAVEQIFRAPADKLPAFVGVDLGSRGYGLYQISKVIPPDTAEVENLRAQAQQQFSQLHSQQDLNSYLESVKSRSDVKRNLSRIRTTPADAQ